MKSRSFWCGGVAYSSTFSIIRMNVNTVERALLLSQGIYLDYIWTLFFRKKRLMIWSLVIRLLGKDFTKSSGSFSVLILKTMNKGPTFYHGKTQVFFKILANIRNDTEFSFPFMFSCISCISLVINFSIVAFVFHSIFKLFRFLSGMERIVVLSLGNKHQKKLPTKLWRKQGWWVYSGEHY